MSKRNPLAWAVRRFPAAFDMEWTEDETFIRTGPATYDRRPIRILSAGWVPDGWSYVGDEWPAVASSREAQSAASSSGRLDA